MFVVAELLSFGALNIAGLQKKKERTQAFQYKLMNVFDIYGMALSQEARFQEILLHHSAQGTNSAELEKRNK